MRDLENTAFGRDIKAVAQAMSFYMLEAEKNVGVGDIFSVGEDCERANQRLCMLYTNTRRHDQLNSEARTRLSRWFDAWRCQIWKQSKEVRSHE